MKAHVKKNGQRYGRKGRMDKICTARHTCSLRACPHKHLHRPKADEDATCTLVSCTYRNRGTVADVFCVKAEAGAVVQQ